MADGLSALPVITPAYRPPWYPNKDPSHNPWVVVNSVTGTTHYEVWVGTLEPGELLRLICESQAA